MGMVIKGHDQLKLKVSQIWIDGTNWYFAFLWKFRKAKNYFNDFWVSVVRNGHGHLVHQTLKSAVSKEWVDELSWFFACWLWGNNSWLDQHHAWYLWLLNAVLLQLYLSDNWSHEIRSVCHSIVCWSVFLELDYQDSLNFSMVLETHVRDFLGKIFLPPKLGKCAKNRSKIGFFE